MSDSEREASIQLTCCGQGDDETGVTDTEVTEVTQPAETGVAKKKQPKTYKEWTKDEEIELMYAMKKARVRSEI